MEEKTRNWYDRNHKIFLFIVLAFFVFCLVYLFIFQGKNGDIIYKDVSLTGGTTITIFDQNADINIIKEKLRERFEDINLRQISDFGTGKQKGFFVETGSDSEEIKKEIETIIGYELNEDNSSIEFTSSALSEGFYKQLRFAIMLSFIFMSIVVFIIFRSFVPSFAVILSAFADIVMTLVVVDIIGMKLSIAGIIAFLMLIGYSVDTDILLTSRLIKDNEGSLNSRIRGAFKTGITMTLTSIVAVLVSLVVVYNLSETLRQIFTIITIGLLFDILNTWITNTSLLKIYIERKERRK